MVQRLVRAMAIGAVVSIGCAFLVWRRQRAESRAYEEWWLRRERARANGTALHPELFV
jgi:hypothetical protein